MKQIPIAKDEKENLIYIDALKTPSKLIIRKSTDGMSRSDESVLCRLKKICKENSEADKLSEEKARRLVQESEELNNDIQESL